MNNLRRHEDLDKYELFENMILKNVVGISKNRSQLVSPWGRDEKSCCWRYLGSNAAGVIH